jgi:ribosome recycling factor
MLNFQADVTLTPVERFNMEQVRLVCEEVTDDYKKDMRDYTTSDDVKKAFVIVQEHTKRVASEIHALLHTNCAAGAPSGSDPPT